jgi:S-DNA-T family DNA segregation ATPase FtsK/SpoIIIE
MSTATITPLLGYGIEDEPTAELQAQALYIPNKAINERKAILPAWASNRSQRRQTATWAARHAAHTAAYHGIRLPLYGAKLSSYAPLGLYRSMIGTAKWVLDWEARPLRKNAIATLNASEYEKLSQQYRDQRNVKAGMVTVGLAGLAAGGMWLGVDDSTTMQLGLGTLGALGLGAIGRPRDAKVIEHAVLPASAQRLTPDVITKALASIGLASISRDVDGITFPAPVCRDGDGWLAEVDLPLGVTAAEVIARREKLASGLGRPLGSVWPETDPQASPGRLVLWVGDHDMASRPQSAWPLANAKSNDIFEAFAFGEDSRGRQITVSLAETNVLIGSLPGAGKTTTLRQLLLAASLDPRAEIWAWEFKGTGDLSALSRIATRYRSGLADSVIESALNGLRALRAECERRADVISDLHIEGKCPENKVTSDVANHPGLHPLVVAIDECHAIFDHERFGKEAGRLAEQIIKIGRALGVILILATQRPNKDSLPTGVRANVGTRFCLRVMDQIANDMILGDGAYRSGIDATLFTKRDRGMGYLLGEHDEPRTLRVYNVGAEAAESIIERALTLRGGEPQSGPRAVPEEPQSGRDILSDTLAIIESHEQLPEYAAGIWWDPLCEGLRALAPEYAGLTVTELRGQLKAHGIKTWQLWGLDHEGVKRNRKGPRLVDVQSALNKEIN